MLSGEATNTNCIVFGLTRLGLQPTIYRTLGEHVNRYATDDVVMGSLNFLFYVLNTIDRKVQCVKVNNSLESSKSECKQFLQYQQSKCSRFKSLNIRKTTYIALEMHVLVWRANIAGLNRLIESQSSLLVYMYAEFNFPKTYIWI